MWLFIGSFNTSIDKTVILHGLNTKNMGAKDAPDGFCILCVERIFTENLLRNYVINELKPTHSLVKSSLVVKVSFGNSGNVASGLSLS